MYIILLLSLISPSVSVVPVKDKSRTNSYRIQAVSIEAVEHLYDLVDPDGERCDLSVSTKQMFCEHLTSHQLIELLQSEKSATELDAIHNEIVETNSDSYSDRKRRSVPWNLDRLNEMNRVLDNSFLDGADVDVYILGSGIRQDHAEFGNRVQSHSVTSDDVDCDGSGTKYASLVGGESMGIARKAQLISVKVVTCNGGVSETNPADVTKGINWIKANIERSGKRSVVLVGFTKQNKDLNLNKQLIDLSEAGEGGIMVVVGAGNNNDLDACKSSPASAKGESAISGVISVGAIDDNDKVISNIGECVDVFGPGYDVPAAGNSDATAKRLCSGSVCAAALAAGVAAQHLRDNKKIDLETQKAMLINGATITDLILPVDTNYYRTLLKSQTPRRVLYYTCGYYRDPSLPECEVYTADCNNSKVTTFDGIDVPLYTQTEKECDFVVFENSERTVSVEGSHYDCTLGTYAIMVEQRQIELIPGPRVVVDSQDISEEITNTQGSLLIYEDEGVVEVYHEVRDYDGYRHPTIRVELLEHKIQITYDCNSKLIVKLLSISKYSGKTSGLCGFYDGIGVNDYQLNDGSTLKKYSKSYHTSWQKTSSKKCSSDPDQDDDPSCREKVKKECDKKFESASPDCFNNKNLYKEKEACISELSACCSKHKNLDGWEIKCCQDSYFGNLERAQHNCSICPETEHCTKDKTHVHCIDDSVKDKYDYMEVIKYEPKDCCYSIDKDDQKCLAPRSPAMEWDKPMPVCTIKKCSRPDVPDHTKITPDQSEYECGETIRVQCDDCYKVTPTILTCTGPKDSHNNTGVWDKYVPACIEKKCSDPGLPLIDRRKAGIKYPLSWVKGPLEKMCSDKVKFQCDICYDMIGADTITCEETERWNPANPYCKLRSCNDPVKTLTEHLEIEVRRKDCNETIKHSCDDICWRLHGAESRTCKVDDNGLIQWDQQQPECRIKTCPRLNKDDFSGAGKYTYITGSGQKTVDLSPSSTSSPNECGAAVTAVCDDCHFMCGDKNRSCVVDGVDDDPYWTGERPTCLKKECRPFENNVSETHATSAYKLESKYECKDQIEMECVECYEYLSGSKVRTCQEDPATAHDPFDSATIWDGEQYKCKIKNCDKLIPPTNGQILTSPPPLNTCAKIVKFGCDKCYYMEGTAEITCQNDKSWSANAPKCTLWTCPKRYHPTDGAIVAPNSINCGDVIKYKCDTCHYMVGANDSQCLVGGTWSNAEPTCNRYVCNAQSEPENGAITVNRRMCGETTEFKCDKCHEMKGKKATTCQHGARWSHKAPKCTMRMCKKPTVPKNTLIEPVKELYNCGEEIQVKCPECYELGTTILVCEGETWSGVVPPCGMKECPKPGLPVVDSKPYIKDVLTGAAIIHSSYVKTPEINCGAKVSYKCDVCYTMLGKDTITCHPNKEWDTIPTCQIKKCDTPVMTSHLKLKMEKSADYTYVCRDSIEYECDHKCYALQGLKQFCEPDGEAVKAIWSPKQPYCTIIKCPALPLLEHGSINTTVNTCGTVVTYTCQPCYRLTGPETRECTHDGVWSTDSPPTCEPVCCPKLEVPTSNTYYDDRTLAYMTYTYTYAEEKIEGCGEDHVCQEVDVKCHDCWEYIREDGKSLSSPPSRVCTHPASDQGQGYWTNTDKMCTRKTCRERLPPKENYVNYISKIMKDLTNCNDKITWECQPCYENFKTSMYQTCKTDKNWSDVIPVCELKECRSLPQIDHCTFKDGYKTCGLKRMLECDECYYTEECQDVTNTEIISVQCKTTKDWQWRVKEPKITIKTCEAPRVIENASLAKNGDGYECGRMIRYQCNECYKMEKKRECDCAELTCVGSGGSSCKMGSWKGEWPTCVPMQCSELPVPDHAKPISSDYGCKQVTRFECDVGYEWIDGDLERTCTTSETWTGKQPICRIKKCTALSAPTDGQISTLERTYLTTVVFTCNDCYEFPRNMTDDSFQEYKTDYQRYHILTCEASGNWNGSVPACAKKSCGHPPIVNNADLDGNKFSCGDQTNYKCRTGYYKKSGDDTRICQHDKRWDGDKIECEVVSCGKPTTGPHCSVESTVNTYKGTALYTCDTCYNTEDVTKVECIPIKDADYGQWNQSPPKCKMIQCPDISVPKNGGIVSKIPSKGQYDCQQIIAYTCNEGYVISKRGPRSTMCLDSGTWSSPTPPTCERRCCRQPVPTQFNNGQIFTPNGYCYGDKIEYKCDKCYEIKGDNYHTCESNGYWSSKNPRCQLITCPIDFTFENGYHSGKASCGGSRDFFCHQGFTRQGADSLKCLENGKWSGAIPTCRSNTCDCSAIDTAHATTNVQHGPNKCGALTTVRYTCVDGYEIKGSSVIWCNNDGDWSAPPPTCSKDQCKAPDTPTNGAVTFTSLYQNGQASYSCNDCYKMDGYSSSICLDGEWTHNPPKCSEITCSEPGVPTNGVVSEPTRTEFSCGEKITYTCNLNHKLHGDNVRSCQKNGRWSTQVPVCTDLECDKLPLPENGNMFVYDDKAEFTCNTGYQLHGTALRECLKGQWLGVEASCKIQVCGDPGIPSFGSRNGDSFNYKDIVTFSCNHGYDLRNSNDRICQHDGTWSGLQPECVCNTCDQLNDLANGMIKTTLANSFRSVVEYDCDPGYEISGNDTRECLASGEWTGVAPTCEKITCGSPQVPEAGSVVSRDGMRYQDSMRIKCSNKREFNGLCGADGQWTFKPDIPESCSCTIEMISTWVEVKTVQPAQCIFGRCFPETTSTKRVLKEVATEVC